MSGVTEAQYEEAKALGCTVDLISRKRTAIVDLSSIRQSGQDYLATVSPNTRYQIKRAVKIYQNRGPLALHSARSVDQALKFFDELGRLHEVAWQKRGPGGAWRYPFLVAFHRRLIERAFPAGGIDIVKVSCGDTPIGYLYCLVRGGWIGSYLSGFAYEEDNKVKPGLVSFYLYIQHKLETKGDVLDFLAGDHRYKTSLGQPGPALYWFRIQQQRPQFVVERGLRRVKQYVEGLRRAPAERSC
jgi:CelD/BcsL family acetyltransferase involved in cellulose biosynthesis